MKQKLKMALDGRAKIVFEELKTYRSDPEETLKNKR